MLNDINHHEGKHGMTAGTFFTPSYIGDLARVIWLRRSIEAFHETHRRHIVAVPRQDLKAFQNALGHSKEVELICQEELVDPGFYPDSLYKLTKKLAPGQVWRLDSHAGKPGWIIQQIVKLSSNRLIKSGPIIFLDSDIFFYRRFSLEKDLGLHEGKRVLVRILPESESGKHRHHIANSRRFFELPKGQTDTTYMATPAIWHPNWLSQMQRHIENLKGKPWQMALLAADFNISEYTLYGVFVDEVLKPDNLTVRDHSFDLIAWDRASFDTIRSDVLNNRSLPAEKFSLCIQSNLNIPISDYEDMLQAILNQAKRGTDA